MSEGSQAPKRRTAHMTSHELQAKVAEMKVIFALKYILQTLSPTPGCLCEQ